MIDVLFVGWVVVDLLCVRIVGSIVRVVIGDFYDNFKRGYVINNIFIL